MSQEHYALQRSREAANGLDQTRVFYFTAIPNIRFLSVNWTKTLLRLLPTNNNRGCMTVSAAYTPGMGGFLPRPPVMATSQAVIAAAVGRASRQSTMGPPSPRCMCGS